MAQLAERDLLVASLRDYLEELLETGVSDLSFGGESAAANVTAPAVAPAAGPAAATMAPPAAAAAEEPAAPLCRTIGNPAARLAFVMSGDGYGGEAGELLAKMIQAMGFTVEEVYLVCFDEAAAPSRAALLAVLHKVDPEAVVALGACAAQLLLNSDAALHDLRGSFSAMEGAPVMPTWHPEVLVNNPALKRDAWNDLQQVMRRLGMGRN